MTSLGTVGSAVYVISDRALAVVVLEDGREVERHTLSPVPGQLEQSSFRRSKPVFPAPFGPCDSTETGQNTPG